MNSLLLSPNTSKRIFYLGICVLMISLSFFLGDGNRNLLLIAVMGTSPLLLILTPIITRTDVKIYFIIILTILCPLLNHPETMRWSTVLYSCMFCLYFISFSHLFSFSNIPQYGILKFLKSLLIAYTIVLCFQQICVLLGIPIFNLSNYDIQQPWKLNSLMSEPEHSSRMIALLMYSYLAIKSANNDKKSFIESWKNDKLLWLAFFWCMLTSMSAGAYLFLLIVLTKFISAKSGFRIIILIFSIFIIANIFLEPIALKRFIKFSSAILTFDIYKIYDADQSAALRIIPSIICLQKINLFTVDGWFGSGIDYVSDFMSNYLVGVPKGYTGGGLFSYAVEYGFLPFIVFVIITFQLCYDKENKIPTTLFWVFSILLVGINSQLAWSTIILLYIIKYHNNNEYTSASISAFSK